MDIREQRRIQDELVTETVTGLLSDTYRQPLTTENTGEDISSWKQKLTTNIPALDLPWHRQRPAQVGTATSVSNFTTPPARSEALKQLAQQRGADTFTLLLAAFEALLYRHTGQEDFAIQATFGREPYSLRAQVSSETTFSTFLDQVRTALEATRHHAEIDSRKFQQVQFVFSDSSEPISSQQPQNFSATDLSLSLHQNTDGLQGEVHFKPDLFERATIDRFIEHYQKFLESVLADPDQALSRLPILPENERRQIVEDWNATNADFPREKCVHQIFEEQAQKTPDAVAIVFRDQQLTYRELNEKANQLARELRRLGVGPDMCVGVCMLRSLEMVVALYAVHKAGGAYVPMDPTYPADRIKFMIQDANVSLILTQTALEGLVAHENARVLCIDAQNNLPAEDPSNLPSTANPENLAYVMFTSGSTGKPKGAMVKHRNVVNFYQGLDAMFHPGPQTWLAGTSISFDISVTELFYPLARGQKVVVLEDEPATVRKISGAPSSSESFTAAEQIKRYGITHFQCTPSRAGMMLEDPQTAQAMRHIKVFVLGGEPVPPSLAQRLAGDNEIIDVYGPTEATVWCSYHSITAHGGRVSIGRPMPNTQMYILDEFLQPVPVGVAGEIYIGGEGVCRGYLHRPELTAQRFIPNPFGKTGRIYRTGDLGRFRPDGEIEILGRIDFQVKIRGYRIELGEIETVLRQQPGVKETVISVWNAGPEDTRLVAYYVAAPGTNPTVLELRRALKGKLPDYMVPSIFTRLDRLPMTPNGKIDRKSLPQPQALPAVDSDSAPDAAAPTPKVLRPRQPASKGDVVKNLPLTEGQREIWLGTQMSQDISCSYNQSVLLTLRGPLDPQRLVETLAWLVERHEALRMTFSPRGDQQQIHSSMPVEVVFEDLSQNDVQARQSELDRLLHLEAEIPFDLEQGPLFRATLIKKRPEEHAFMLTLHHLVCDGTGLAIVLDELGEKYSAEATGKPGPGPLEQTFSQYVQQQIDAAHSEEATVSELYWLEQYSSPAKKVALPMDRPAASRRKLAGASRAILLSPELAHDLRKLAAENRCTLTATLLAAFYILLQRVSGQDDLIVGLPITARSGPGSDALVGHCVNFLPLRLQINNDLSFSEHLMRVWTLLIESLEHGNITLGTLLQKLESSCPHDSLPVPTVVFNLDCVLKPLASVGLKTTVEANPYVNSRFDTMLEVSEAPDRLEVFWQYNPELFNSATIDRWLEEYSRLLSAMTADPSRPLAQYAPTQPLAQQATPVSSQPMEDQNNSAATMTAEPATMTAEPTQPQNPTETKLIMIWREIGILEEVGRHDSFFDVGGHSLLATKVVSRILKTFEVELPLRVIFEAPTIAELAEAVARAQKTQPKAAAPSITATRRTTQKSTLVSKLANMTEAELQKLLSKIK